MSESIVRLPLRISANLKAKLTALAKREHRSLNKQIEFLLERAVLEEPQGGPEERKAFVRFKPK